MTNRKSVALEVTHYQQAKDHCNVPGYLEDYQPCDRTLSKKVIN